MLVIVSPSTIACLYERSVLKDFGLLDFVYSLVSRAQWGWMNDKQNFFE